MSQTQNIWKKTVSVAVKRFRFIKIYQKMAKSFLRSQELFLLFPILLLNDALRTFFPNPLPSSQFSQQYHKFSICSQYDFCSDVCSVIDYKMNQKGRKSLPQKEKALHKPETLTWSRDYSNKLTWMQTLLPPKSIKFCTKTVPTPI